MAEHHVLGDLVRGVPSTARRLGWERGAILVFWTAYMVDRGAEALAADRWLYALAKAFNPLIIGLFVGAWFARLEVPDARITVEVKREEPADG